MYFGLIRHLNTECLKTVSTDQLYKISGTKIEPFHPKNLKDFNPSQHYGTVVNDENGVKYVHKVRIVLLADTEEEITKLISKGKLPRINIMKYESNSETKVLYSTFVKHSEKASSSASGKRKHPPNSGINGNIVKALKVHNQQTDKSKGKETTQENPTVSSNSQASQEHISDLAAGFGLDLVEEAVKSEKSSEVQIDLQVETVEQGQRKILRTPSDNVIEIPLPPSASQAGTPCATGPEQAGPSSTKNNGQILQEEQDDDDMEMVNTDQTPPYLFSMMNSDFQREILKNQIEIKASILKLESKVDFAISVLKGSVSAASCPELRDAVSLDSDKDSFEPPAGQVHLGDGRCLNIIWAESIVGAQDCLQWKVKQLVSKMFHDDPADYYLQLPKAKEGEQKPNDKRFPEACIEGLCNFINSCNTKAAKFEIGRRKRLLPKTLTEEEVKEQISMIEGHIMSTVQVVTTSNIRGILQKVLFNLRKSKEAKQENSIVRIANTTGIQEEKKDP